nr:MAG TPA: hypothetical protein [Caudoviricetes sp.]
MVIIAWTTDQFNVIINMFLMNRSSYYSFQS